MWNRRCTWSNTVKMAVSGVFVLAASAVFFLPSPSPRVQGGIELIGVQPEVEVYGPEIPTSAVSGYTSKVTNPIFAADTEDDTIYVYAAKSGECYHEYECKFAYASSQRLTLYEAHFLGYKPCGLCKPPEYTPGM